MCWVYPYTVLFISTWNHYTIKKGPGQQGLGWCGVAGWLDGLDAVQ